MNTKFVKVLSVLFVAALGAMLSACGSKGTEKADVDEYVYTSSFKKVNLNLENGFVGASKLTKDSVVLLTTTYDPNDYTKQVAELHNIDLNTEEDKVITVNGLESETYVEGFNVEEDGSYTLLLNRYVMSQDSYKQYNMMAKMDSNGQIFDTIDITDAVEAAGGYLSDYAFDKEGNLYITVDDCVVVIDKNGKTILNKKVGNWINGIFADTDGNIYVRYYGNSDVESRTVDLAKKDLGPVLEGLPTNGDIVAGPNGTFLALTGTGVYLFDINTKNEEKLFTWIDTDIENYSAKDFIICDDGTYKMAIQDYSGSSPSFEIVTFTKGLKSKSDKKVIKYGCFYMDYDIKEKIIKFNKSNPDYKIEVESFSDDSSYDSYEENIKAFDLAVMEKGRFDVIDLSNLEYEKYAKKGILADLNDFLKKDKDISRESLFESVLKANEIDGHLYRLTPFFTIQALVGSKEKLKDVGTWNTASLVELRKKYPDVDFMEYMTKEYALSSILTSCIGDFINPKTGDCNFVSEEFYNICEYANTFPADINYDDAIDEWALIKSGDIILTSLYMNEIASVEIYSELFGNDLEIVGYPSKEGALFPIYANSPIAISATSKNKDGAWTFVKELLDEEYQIKNSYSGFPLLKSAFDAKMKDEMAVETYIDENGQVQKVEKGGWGNGSTMVYYYGASESTVNRVREIIENVSLEANYDEQVYKIILEEVQAYFSGSKSKEDVANIIQSRVKIYLAENM